MNENTIMENEVLENEELNTTESEFDAGEPFELPEEELRLADGKSAVLISDFNPVIAGMEVGVIAMATIGAAKLLGKGARWLIARGKTKWEQIQIDRAIRKSEKIISDRTEEK